MKERKREREREREKERETLFAWSNPGTWKTSRYSLVQPHPSLGQDLSVPAASRSPLGLVYFYFSSSPDMLLVWLSPWSLPARVLGLQHPFCRWGGDRDSCFCHALKLSRLRGKEEEEDRGAAAAALTFEESQEPAARRGNNRQWHQDTYLREPGARSLHAW